MEYEYCSNEGFADFASGCVLVSKAGFTNFPVRLSQEIYCRCLSYFKDAEDLCLYDPFGGAGYLLTTLGFLNHQTIKSIVYSDICDDAIQIAEKNLSLLSDEGLANRLHQIEILYEQYNKPSHLQAIKSAYSLKSMLDKYRDKPTVSICKMDMLNSEVLKQVGFQADIVLADIPYGGLVSWVGDREDAVNVFLDNLVPILKPTSIIAVCSDKKQKIKNNKYRRLEKNQVGKRKFEILCLC